MKVIEYGRRDLPTIIMLHGGGLSWWNFQEEAELLQDRYHIVLPILDGHADSDINFTTIEDNAYEVISYINEKLGGSVLAICGLSLGAQILLEILSQKRGICQYAMIESALILPMKCINMIINSSVSMSYGLIAKPWFAKWQFKTLNIKERFYEDYYKDTCKISKENMISFLKANSSYQCKESLSKSDVQAMILVGGKEQKKMIRSAKLLGKKINNSKVFVLDGYTHGELSLNHANRYIEILQEIIEK